METKVRQTGWREWVLVIFSATVAIFTYFYPSDVGIISTAALGIIIVFMLLAHIETRDKRIAELELEASRIHGRLINVHEDALLFKGSVDKQIVLHLAALMNVSVQLNLSRRMENLAGMREVVRTARRRLDYFIVDYVGCANAHNILTLETIREMLVKYMDPNGLADSIRRTSGVHEILNDDARISPELRAVITDFALKVERPVDDDET